MRRTLPVVGPADPRVASPAMLDEVGPPPPATLPPGARIRIGRTIDFASAHRLPRVPAEHRCSRLHGHNYTVAVELEGPVDDALGWVADFGALSVVLESVVREPLDHRYLNDVPGLENPTSEILAMWIWRRVAACLCVPGVELASVRVSENGRSWATVEAG